MTCKLLSGCENEVFERLDYCALHCEKDNYELDFKSNLLKEFHKLLHLYIIDKLLGTPTQDLKNQSYRNKLIDYRNTYHKNHQNIISALHRQPIFIEFFSKRTVLFEFIHFPEQRYSEYLEVLKLFKGVWFANCVFHIRDLNTESTGVYFKRCIFNNEIRVNKIVLHQIEKNYIFYKCIFNSKIYIDLKDKEKEERVIEYGLFEECDFNGLVSLNNVEFQKEVFKFVPISNTNLKFSERTWLSSILLDNVIFHDKCKFNYIDLVNLVIKNTKFLSKLEVKQSFIKCLVFDDSNVSGVFDAYGSHFKFCYFHKVIFKEFSGFENVIFGDGDKKNLTEFRYTTFKDFSNFRGSNFLSGLDFSNVNLKENPNFLRSEVNNEGSSRETFRIIKNSFDDVGNKLEANRFFIKEMKAYKKELDNSKDTWDKLVYRANEEISNFGGSYMMPSILLVLSLIIYTSLLSIHESFFEIYDYFLYPWVNCLSIQANEFAKNFLPFSRFLENSSGIEFISLLFYIWFAILIWQIIVAVKRHTQR